jgi:hypothetical protein
MRHVPLELIPESQLSLYFFEAAALALRTRLTMVASSIRNARVILSGRK